MSMTNSVRKVIGDLNELVNVNDNYSVTVEPTENDKVFMIMFNTDFGKEHKLVNALVTRRGRIIELDITKNLIYLFTNRKYNYNIVE